MLKVVSAKYLTLFKKLQTQFRLCLNWRVLIKLQMDEIHSTGHYKLLPLPAGAS